MYEKYHAKGFEILDFPCDQFAHQAQGSHEEIHSFCTGRFGITFPQFSKVDVNDVNTTPLYDVYLKNAKKGMIGSSIKWNFTKFLVGRNGEVLTRFAPIDTSQKMDAYIAKVLET